MNSIIKRCTSSLKPSYIVCIKRLLSSQTTDSFGSNPPDNQPKKVPSPPDRFSNVIPELNIPLPPQEISNDQTKYENNVKTKILDASLEFVPVHGWTKNAISAGAEKIGYPGVIHGMFPSGGFDLIQHFYVTANKRLVEILVEQNQPSNSGKSVDGSSREKIEKAVRLRLEMQIPYIKHWPQALATMSSPPNVPTSLANLLCLVDDIFYYTGDKSVDMSWYGRRVILAGIYKATELYMLQDQSEEYSKSWEFLKRRMDEAAQVRSYWAASEQAGQVAKDFATSAFITARSILGLRWDR